MQAYSKKTMMQIPPPSSHFSLFPEVFSPLNTNANNTGETTGASKHGKMKSNHPEETPKKHNAYSSSFALRRSPSSSRSTIRYQESSHFHHQAPMINHQVLRPQQQEHLPSRRMTRNRSPSQKIYSRSCGTTEGNENGNPQIQCPGMANPTSYLAKEYEKSTLRMLERIQKSRSFEKKNQTNAASNLHKSFSSFESSSRNKNATFQQDNNAYYTGDADSGFFIGGDEEDNYFCHSNFDHLDRFDNQDRFGGLGDLQHGVPILEQENNDTEDDEIFELDL